MDGERLSTDEWLMDHEAEIGDVARLNEEMLACDEDARYFAEHLRTPEMQAAAREELTDDQQDLFPELVAAQARIPYEELGERVEEAEQQLGSIALKREAIEGEDFQAAHDLRTDAMVVATRRPALANTLRRKLDEMLASRRQEQLTALDSEQAEAESNLAKLRGVVAKVGMIALPTLSMMAPEPYKRVIEGVSSTIEISNGVREVLPKSLEEQTTPLSLQESEGLEPIAEPEPEVSTESFEKEEMPESETMYLESPGWRIGEYLANHKDALVSAEDVAEVVYGSRDARAAQRVHSLVSIAQSRTNTPLNVRLERSGLQLKREKQVVAATGPGKRGQRSHYFIGAFTPQPEEQA